VDLQLDPEPVVANEPQVINIKEKVLFDFDSYALDAEADSIVLKVSKLMSEYPDTLLILKGHTDKYGSDEYNDKLSLNRSEAVKDALINEGIAEDRIDAVGFGKTQLIPNLTNRENRRVLILSIGE
jgi:outer membrane protein OmpA-like peptidoglycan-associated protein